MPHVLRQVHLVNVRPTQLVHHPHSVIANQPLAVQQMRRSVGPAWLPPSRRRPISPHLTKSSSADSLAPPTPPSEISEPRLDPASCRNSSTRQFDSGSQFPCASCPSISKLSLSNAGGILPPTSDRISTSHARSYSSPPTELNPLPPHPPRERPQQSFPHPNPVPQELRRLRHSPLRGEYLSWASAARSAAALAPYRSTICRDRHPVTRIRSPSFPPARRYSCANVCRNMCGCTRQSQPGGTAV